MKALTLRLPDELHESLRQQAFEGRTSITALIVSAIESAQPRKGCDVCGKPSVMVSTPGGIRFCQAHRPSTPSTEEETNHMPETKAKAKAASNISITFRVGPSEFQVDGGDIMEPAAIGHVLRDVGAQLHRIRGALLLGTRRENHGF